MRRKLALSLLAAICACPLPARAQVGPPNQLQCNQLISQSASTTSLATLLAGVAGKVIVVCGWHVTSSSGTASTFQLSSGTGTNCATTNVNLTPAFNVTSTAPSADHVDFAQLSIPAGNNLCIISSGTSLQPSVWVGQY
jgi:hypothetical protein